MRSLLLVIDSISEHTGKTIRWACLALVMVMTYEVIVRYVFNKPTMWTADVASTLGATIVTLGWAYTHKYHKHVRVDVIYSHLSTRAKAIIDVVGALLIFFPLVITLTYISGVHMWFSWSIGEKLTATYWYPPAGPIRTVVFLGLILFILQGVAHFIRDLYLLIKDKAL